MFAFTKQQKLNKAIKEAQVIYNKLVLEPFTSDTVKNLQWEKEQIEKERLALSYDMLKQEITEFALIASSSEAWKIDKPGKAEGMLLGITKKVAMACRLPTIRDKTQEIAKEMYGQYTRDMDKEIRRISDTGVMPFLKKAVLNKIKADALSTKADHWKELTGLDTIPTTRAYLLSKLLKQVPTNVMHIESTISIDNEELMLIAKYHHINILIIKG